MNVYTNTYINMYPLTRTSVARAFAINVLNIISYIIYNIYINVLMYIYTYTYIYIICIYNHTHTCAYIPTHTHTRTLQSRGSLPSMSYKSYHMLYWIHVQMYSYAYINIYIYIYIGYM